MVFARGLQILPDGEEIHIGRAQVVHHLQDFVAGLAEAYHDAGLGEHLRIDLLHPLQEAQRMEIARARPHREVERGHGFQIMVEHVGLGFDHFFERAVLAQEIGGEHLDGGLRTAGADGAHGVGKMRSAAVGEIVAVDAGDDDMREAELGGRLRHVFRLGRVERARQPGLHIAEGAGARAGVAHDHEGGVLLLPALADVGAAGLLTHGV